MRACVCVCERECARTSVPAPASGGRVMFLLSMALARELIKDLKRLTLCQWTVRLCVVAFTNSSLQRTYSLPISPFPCGPTCHWFMPLQSGITHSACGSHQYISTKGFRDHLRSPSNGTPNKTILISVPKLRICARTFDKSKESEKL